MWGHTGDWPLTDEQKLVVDNAGGYMFRRVVQRWRLANARAEPDLAKRPARIRAARRMLQAKERNASAVRGAAEWIPRSATRQALLYVASRGCEFTWAPDAEAVPAEVQ
jgi:hypothetical protein